MKPTEKIQHLNDLRCLKLTKTKTLIEVVGRQMFTYYNKKGFC